MEKLMKPAEYAKELGISRQAVYAKIKKGILTSKNVEGKLYIVVDKVNATETVNRAKNTITKVQVETSSAKDYKALLQAKDETISVLKETVVDLKESNKQISSTLRSEIDLLKDAFHEMRTLYVIQLEHKQNQEPEDAIDVSTDGDSVLVEEENWIGLKKFFKQQNITKTKQQDKIKKYLKKAYKNGDTRLEKFEGKLRLNTAKKYKDILK